MLKLIQYIYLFLLVFSPLAFGSVELWSKAIMEGMAFLALFLFLAFHKPKDQPFYHVPGLWPLLLLPAYMLLQTIPLPESVVKLLSPQTHALYQESIGLLEPVNWMSISINQKDTLSEFFRYGSYACFYILSVQLLSDKHFLKKAVHTVVIFIALLSFFSILQHFTSDGKIFWFKELYRGTPFGPYVNRNHFAGLVGMTFPLVLAMFLYSKPKVSYTGLRTRLAEFFSYRSTNTYFLLGTGLVLVGLSVFLSLSRGGMISLSVSTCVFGLLLAFRSIDRARGFRVFTIFLLILLAVGWFGWDPIFERFNQSRDSAGEIDEARLPRWQASLDAAQDYPITGTGLGTFMNIYKGYRFEPAGKAVTHAHNDYIELMVEGGIIAVCLATWFLVSIVATYRQFLKRHDPLCIYLYIAGLAGLLAIMIHSITDFNLHIPSNGLYFYFICAICVAAAHTRHYSAPTKTRLLPIRSRWVKLTALPAVALLISALMYNGGEYLSSLKFKALLTIYKADELADKDYKQIRTHADSAISYDPLNSFFYMIFGNAEKSLGQEKNAFSYFKKAIWLNPTNGVYLQTIGEAVADMGDKRMADRLLQAGTRRDVNSSHRYANYAYWLLENGNRDKGVETMRQAIAMSPRQTRRYLELLVDDQLLANNELARVLPERVESRIVFAEYLEEHLTEGLIEGKRIDLVNAAYKDAMSYLDKEEKVQPPHIFKIYRYYMKQKRYEDALAVMQKGMTRLPENGKIRATVGSLYEKLGIPYRAVEEYKTALVFDPKNKLAKRRLQKLQPQ